MDERLHRFHAEMEDTHWWLAAKNRILASLIRRYAPARTDGRRPQLLDIGCGSGGLMRLLGPRFDTIGVDPSPLARAAARARGQTALDGTLPDHIPEQLRACRFDVVVMSEVLEHIERDRAALEAAVQLLAPRGLLVCTVPAHPWMWSSHDVLNHHARRYTRRGFASLFDGLPPHPPHPPLPLYRLILSPANTAAFPLMAIARCFRRGRVSGTGCEGCPPSDIRLPPRPINAVLRAAFAAERYWLPHARLPFGGSLLSVHLRRDAAPTPPAPEPGVTRPHTTRPEPAATPPSPIRPLASAGDPA